VERSSIKLSQAIFLSEGQAKRRTFAWAWMKK
jgi:hypothetical protein